MIDSASTGSPATRTSIFTIGETYDWKILSIEPRTHRMGLLPVRDGSEKIEKTKKEAPAKEVKEEAAPTEEKAA